MLRARFVQERTTEADIPDNDLNDFALFDLAGLDATFYRSATTRQMIRDVAWRLVRASLPPEVQSAVATWHSSLGGHADLVVEASPEFVDLPWELLASFFGDGMFVIRRRLRRVGSQARRPNLPVPAKVLACGWEKLHGGGVLPGISGELQELSGLAAESFSVQTLREAPLSTFAEETNEANPQILHLAIASGFRFDRAAHEPRTEIALFPDGPHPPVYDTSLLSILSRLDDLRLILANTQPNPVAAEAPLLRRLCEGLGVAVVGWVGGVEDNIAVDFAKFWYQRARDGMTIAEISQSFTSQFGPRQWVEGAVPIIWVPSMAWIDQPVLQTERTRGIESFQTKHRTVSASEPTVAVTDPNGAVGPPTLPDGGDGRQVRRPQVDVLIDLHRTLFPALLVNDNRPLKTITVESDRDFHGRVVMTCDVGGRQSSHRMTFDFVEGTNVIPGSDIDFPAIYELIPTDERRVISFTVSVYEQDLLAELTRPVNWLSRRDWLNSEDGWPYVSAYVLPMTLAVSKVTNEAQAILAQIGRPGDRFEGYPAEVGDGTIVYNQMRSIFQAVRALDIRYIAPPGLPVHVFNPARMDPDDDPLPRASTARAGTTERPQPIDGQIVRTPEDVLERTHGTCHDLALLLAAAVEYVGMFPLVILMPGHTYYGYWTERQAHLDYWNDISSEQAVSERPWTIPSRKLAELVGERKIAVVEPNMAAHPRATFDQALRRAAGYADDANQVVDVRRSRSWVRPVLLF